MEPIKIVVHGALGRVGREVVRAFANSGAIRTVGAVDLKATSDYLFLPEINDKIPISTDLSPIINATKPDVIVDFSLAKAVINAARTAISKKVNMVIGTTGLTAEELDEIDRMAKAQGVGVVVAPNFALGAILMMHLSKIAAKYMDYAEIIEMHHNQKADAPSGTALATAIGMAKSRGKPLQTTPGPSRGTQVEGTVIHSVRLPGLLAHQEVIFGALGQTLRIRHDTINAECYIPGVTLAIKDVVKRKGMVFGLNTIMGLQEI